jgi:hypothetical protein
MVQHRNEHDLMKDFADEIPGYLLNRKIAGCLGSLSLSRSLDDIGHNLRLCYESLVAAGMMDRRELFLMDAWLKDLATIGLISAINAATSKSTQASG